MQITHFVKNGAVQTAYHDLPAITDQQRLPLVCVHGFTGSKMDFIDHLPWLSEQRRVLAYDQRGHGESSNLAPYSLYALTADLINFLDVMQLSQCHILGHSLGGMVVMRALLSHPQRFSSAILMDTSAYPVNLIADDMRARLATLVTESGCSALLQGMRGQPQNAAVQRSIDFLGEAEHWRRIEVKLQQMDPQAFISLAEVLNDHPPVLDTLAQLSMPTSVIVGAQDTPFMAPSQALAESISDAQLRIIEDAAHSPQLENHHAWQIAVDRHLQQTGG